MGDYDLTQFGPYYGDPGASIEETIASIESLRKIPAEVWIGGHGAGVFQENPGETWDVYPGASRMREERRAGLL